MFKVLVMSAGSVLDKRVFNTEEEAVDFASDQQDAGFKVRVMDLEYHPSFDESDRVRYAEEFAD